MHELARQPGLPQPGRRDDRHQPRRRAQALRERPLEHRQVLLAADDRRVEVPLQPRRVRGDVEQVPGRHRLRLALRGERGGGLRGDRVADQPVRRLPQQDVARTGVLLEPRRDVDRVPGDETLVGHRLTRDHLAGVDPDAVGDRDAPAGADLLVQAAECRAHLVRRADGPQRVVLVQPWHAEHRHHGVADELLHRAVVPLHHPAHLVEVQRQHASYRLGVEPLAQRGRVDDVAEDHRDGLSHLTRSVRRGGHRRTALRAEPCRRRRLLLAALTPDGRGRIGVRGRG